MWQLFLQSLLAAAAPGAMATLRSAEYKKPGVVRPLQAYKRHIVSEQLEHRYPYLEDINSHLKPDDISTAFGARSFPRLVEQLKMPSIAPEKLSEALRTVCDLCPHQENKSEAVSSEMVAAATNLLMHEAIDVRREAARVVACVVLMISGRSCMPTGNSNMPRKMMVGLAGPTLPRLSKLLLSCDDEMVKRNVAEALRAITIFRDGCQQVVDQGAVKAVSAYLCSTLPDIPPTRLVALCLLDLLRTLGQVSMYAYEGMRDILGVGVIGRVIGFLARVPPEVGNPAVSKEESTDTVREALRVLWHCGNDPRGRCEALDADGVRIVTAYLNDPDAKVRESAVCTLNVISLETLGKKEILKHSTQAIARLLHSEEETKYLHETCVQLARCASELPAFRYAFARHIIASVWLLEKIFGTTSIAAVCPLLEAAEEDDLRTEAAQVILHFLRQEQPGIGDEIRVPPVAPLRHIQNPPMYAIEECTGILYKLVDLIQVAKEPAIDCLDALTDAAKPRKELKELLDMGNHSPIPEDVRAELEAMVLKEDKQPAA